MADNNIANAKTDAGAKTGANAKAASGSKAHAAAIRRVIRMEAAMKRVAGANARLERALALFEARSKDIDALEAYYAGGWQQDFEADERGEFPSELRRGVLSEDALYDVLSDASELRGRLRKRQPRKV